MTIYIRDGGGFTVDKESIPFYRMAALLSALKMEIRGLKSRRINAYMTIKREFGLKGTRMSVYEQFEKLVDEVSAKQERIHEDT